MIRRKRSTRKAMAACYWISFRTERRLFIKPGKSELRCISVEWLEATGYRQDKSLLDLRVILKTSFPAWCSPKITHYLSFALNVPLLGLNPSSHCSAGIHVCDLLNLCCEIQRQARKGTTALKGLVPQTHLMHFQTPLNSVVILSKNVIRRKKWFSSFAY